MRPDVLVAAKQVGRVVLETERGEAFVIHGALAGAHQFLAFLAEPADVELGAAVRPVLRVGPEGPRPAKVIPVVNRILPKSVDAHHPAHVAIANPMQRRPKLADTRLQGSENCPIKFDLRQRDRIALEFVSVIVCFIM